MQNPTVFDTLDAASFLFPGKKIRPMYSVIHGNPYSTALSAFNLCINHATVSSIYVLKMIQCNDKTYNDEHTHPLGGA